MDLDNTKTFLFRKLKSIFFPFAPAKPNHHSRATVHSSPVPGGSSLVTRHSSLFTGHRSSRRPLTPLLSTLIFLFSACALQPVTEPHQVDPANEPTPVPTRVEIAKPTYEVDQGDVVREVRLSGKIVPVLQLSLSFAQEGTVADIFFENGSSVSEGDVIASLDTSELQSELILAQNRLEVAEARLAAVESQVANDRRRAEIAVEQAKLQLAFAETKGGDAPSAEQTLEISMRALDVELAELSLSELLIAIDPIIQADIDQAALRIDEINAQIAKAQIVAPTDGTITRININEGRISRPEETAISLSDLSRLDVRALVLEEDLPLIALDMSGIVQLASRPGEPVEAIISLLPVNAGGEGEEESIVRFRMADDGQSFDVNDRVTVDLLVAEQPDALWLPPQAIREFSGRKFVVVQDGDGQRRVDIKTGLENDDQVEIVSGLELGDVVVGQ